MANKKIYEVEVAGTDKAATTLRAFEDTFAKGGTAAAQKFGDVFKGLSRDIDVIGGNMTAKATKAISDVLGVAEAIGSGGVLGPIALVSAAIGGVVTLVGQWRSEEEDARKAAEAFALAAVKADKAHAAALDDLIEKTVRLSAVMTDADMARLNVKIRLLQAEHDDAAAGVEAAQANLERARTEKNSIEEIVGATKVANAAKAESDARLATLRKLLAERNTALARQEKAEQRDMDRDAAKASVESFDKAETKKDNRAQQTADFYAAAVAKMAEADARRLAQQTKDGEDYQRQQDESTARLEALQMEDSAAADAEKIRQQEEAMRLEKEHIDLVTDRKQKELDLARALRERVTAQNQADMAMLQGAAVNQTYAMSLLVVQSVMGPVTAQLQQYGQINRENYREMLEINENTIAAWAAMAQAALWSLAMQAGGKATMETAEAIKETALAFGSMAMKDYEGAGEHAASAAVHTVAAQAYAGLAGTSAGVSLGIGAMRGEGGLFGLTKEEQEKKDRENREGMGPAQGGPAARGGGGTGNNGPTVVNFIYEAGAIDARSRDAAAATVSAASREARRSGFYRQNMRA